MDLKYELEAIEQLIHRSLNPGEPVDTCLSDRDKHFLWQEEYRIKEAFTRAVFSPSSDRKLERYFQQHQQAILRICESLYQDIPPHILDQHPLPDALYQCLTRLLHFIQRHFERYFDVQAKAPYVFLAIIQKELQLSCTAIDQKMHAFPGLSKWAELPVKELRKCLEVKPADNTSYSFSQLLYLKDLSLEIEHILSEKQVKSTSLLKSLFYMNFNSLRFFFFCTQYISSYYKAASNLHHKKRRLAFIDKIIRQAPVRNGIAFKNNRNSVKTMLTEWIAEEISFLEKSQTNSGLQPGCHAPAHKPSSERLNLNFSVAQLALLIRLMAETGQIRNPNTTEILRFFAAQFSTRSAEEISFGSLRSKYYNPEEGTREALAIWIRQALQHLDNIP